MLFSGKGGKNRRRGKNDNEGEKRELQFKEDGQGKWFLFRVYVHHALLSFLHVVCCAPFGFRSCCRSASLCGYLYIYLSLNRIQ